MMKAIVQEKYGSPDVLVLKEVEKPIPRDNEVLVKVHAASINSWDLDVVTGTPYEYRLFSGILRPKNKIGGCDIAGHVEVVGKNVTRFKVGDEVYGDMCFCGFGAFAEYKCAREIDLEFKPASMTFEQAAALPQGGLLALQSFQKKENIKPTDKILINGGGGAVGTIAIQMAKAFGCHTTVVDSVIKFDVMRSLGADQVIDYTREDFTRSGKTYDLIIDVKTNRPMSAYARALNPGGVYATVGGKSLRIMQLLFSCAWFKRKQNKSLIMVMYEPNKGLTTLNELFLSGKVKPVIDKIFQLDETSAAFKHFAEGKFKGKIVIKVD